MLSGQVLVTVVMPVYNRVEYLDEAIQSVFAQTSSSWQLLLADDRSDDDAWKLQESYAPDPRVRLIRQTRNIGLFANLNAALSLVHTPYALLLCSDDRLKPDAVARLLATTIEYPNAELVLSSFDTIDETGNLGLSQHHRLRLLMTRSTRLLGRLESREFLLRFGSYNGNLTGMFFRLPFYERVGPFRSDWRHAADWEWVCRAASVGSIVLSIERVADVRNHDGQLSSANRVSGHQVTEASAVLRALLADQELAHHPRAQAWARHSMQHFAWLAIRAFTRGDMDLTMKIMREIDKTSGLVPTVALLLMRMPIRLVTRVLKVPQAPPQ